MNVIIVGCGNVGYALVERLTGEKHNVVVIDKDKKKTEGSQSKDSAEKAGDEYSEDGSSAPEDAEDSPRMKPQSKEYVSTILQLIKKLEQIQKAYEDEDYDNCESQVEIACFILDDLDAEDDNVKTITGQLEKWKQRLGMTS